MIKIQSLIIITILEILLVSCLSSSNQTATGEASKIPLQSTFKTTSLEQPPQVGKVISDLQKQRVKIDDVKTKLHTSSKDAQDLKKSLDSTKQQLSTLEQKLKTAKKEEMELLLHDISHINREGLVPFSEKMTNLPNIINDVITQTQLLKAATEKVPKSTSITLLQSKIANLQKDLNSLKTFHKNGEYQRIEENLQKIRNEFISESLKIEKKYQLPQSKAIMTMLTANKDLRLKMRMNFPFNLHDDKSLSTEKVGNQLQIFVCLVKWTATDVEPEVALSDTYQQEFQKFNDYIQEVSYGNLSATVTFSPIVTWSGPLPSTDPREEMEAAVELCDPFVDFNKIDGFFIYPTRDDEITGRGRRFTNVVANEGEIPSLNVVFLKRFSEGLIKHESGHALFGMLHATSINCGSSPFEDFGCSINEYGNPYDVMGRGAGRGGHYSAFSKELQGWVTAREILGDGTYELDALEVKSAGPKLLKIQFPNPLCIEYRKPLGLDNAMFRDIYSYFEVPASPPETGCLLINLCQYTTMLVDTTPNSFPVAVTVDPELYDDFDACIPIGREFSSDVLGITRMSFIQSAEHRHAASVTIDIDESRLS